MKDKNEKKTLDEILEGVDDLEKIEFFGDGDCMRSNKLEMIFACGCSYKELVRYEGCDNRVKIPNGVTTIGPAAFSHDPLLRTVDMPDSVEEIGDYAFYYCHNIRGNLGNNVKRIGKRAFALGHGNWFLMELPDSVEFVCDEALIFLEFDRLPKNLKHIGASAFSRGYWGNRGYWEIGFDNEEEWYAIIPDKVTEIGEYAFSDLSLGDNCNGIWLPLSVKKIGKKAFSHITADDKEKTTLCYEGGKEDWKAIDIDNSDNWLKDIEVKFNCKREIFDEEVEVLEDEEVEELEDEEVEEMEDEEVEWLEDDEDDV